MLNKKADAKIEDWPYLILYTILIGVTAIFIKMGTVSVLAENLQTNNIENHILINRILGALSYNENGREYMGIVDINKFDPELLKRTIDRENVPKTSELENVLAMKITLTSPDRKEREDIFYDEKYYQLERPVAALRHVLTNKKYYVLIMENDETRKGILEFDIISSKRRI